MSLLRSLTTVLLLLHASPPPIIFFLFHFFFLFAVLLHPVFSYLYFSVPRWPLSFLHLILCGFDPLHWVRPFLSVQGILERLKYWPFLTFFFGPSFRPTG